MWIFESINCALIGPRCLLFFPLPPQGRGPCRCHRWLWSLAGCLVTAHFVHSVTWLQRGRNTTGERKCKPQVPDMNIPDASAERAPYCSGRYCENKGTLCRIEGFVLLLIKSFLIMALSWSEHDSVSSSAQLLFIHWARSSSPLAHRTPLFELWQCWGWYHIHYSKDINIGQWHGFLISFTLEIVQQRIIYHIRNLKGS